MNETVTQERLKSLVLNKLNDQLSYEDRKQVLENVDSDFVATKIGKLKRRERYGWFWMIGSQVVMVMMIVTWGLSHGWSTIWSYLLSAGMMGVGYVGIIQYLETVKALAKWDLIASFMNESEPGDVKRETDAQPFA